jgi:hypothetical protein
MPLGIGNLLTIIAATLALLFLAILAIAAVVTVRVGLNAFLAHCAAMSGDRLSELAVLAVVGVTLTVAIFFLALWLLPF